MRHWSYLVTNNDPILKCTRESTSLVTTLLKAMSYLVQYNSLICLRSATEFKALISRKVVGKSARDNPESFNCRWFWVNCSSKKFERMAREAMDVWQRVLKESNKSRFESYKVRHSLFDHIPRYLSVLTRAHFSDDLSRNGCIQQRTSSFVLAFANMS